VTLVLPKSWAGAALWTKQNFEESLGKSEDIGIKVVIGERLRMPNYRRRKMAIRTASFWRCNAKASRCRTPAKLALVRRAGYPLRC
jgi:hypothetical protein